MDFSASDVGPDAAFERAMEGCRLLQEVDLHLLVTVGVFAASLLLIYNATCGPREPASANEKPAAAGERRDGARKARGSTGDGDDSDDESQSSDTDKGEDSVTDTEGEELHSCSTCTGDSDDGTDDTGTTADEGKSALCFLVFDAGQPIPQFPIVLDAYGSESAAINADDAPGDTAGPADKMETASNGSSEEWSTDDSASTTKEVVLPATEDCKTSAPGTSRSNPSENEEEPMVLNMYIAFLHIILLLVCFVVSLQYACVVIEEDEEEN